MIPDYNKHLIQVKVFVVLLVVNYRLIMDKKTFLVQREMLPSFSIASFLKQRCGVSVWLTVLSLGPATEQKHRAERDHGLGIQSLGGGPCQRVQHPRDRIHLTDWSETL